MKTLIYKIDYKTAEKNIQFYDRELKDAALFLKKGKLVVFPTETVYGLGADALNENAVKSIFAVKGRPNDNPLIVHLNDKKDIASYAFIGGISEILIDKFMPGPCTVILQRKKNISDVITGKRETVAIRIPSNIIAQRLIELSETPIAAPSANLSGKPSPTQIYHIESDLDGKVAVLIDGGKCQIGLESTVLSTNESNAVTILRPGAVTREMLIGVLGDKIKIISPGSDKYLSDSDDEIPESPGMKYKHYAPQAPLFLIEEIGEDESISKTIDFMIAKTVEAANKNIGFMCFDEDSEMLIKALKSSDYKVLSIGRRNNPEEQAHLLFDCLNKFNNTDVDVIYSVIPKKEGIGAAVYNRILKAAGYKVIKL